MRQSACREEHDTSNVPSDSVGTPVEHQFMGANIAYKEYGVEDSEVLDAIRYHTTGKEI